MELDGEIVKYLNNEISYTEYSLLRLPSFLDRFPNQQKLVHFKVKFQEWYCQMFSNLDYTMAARLLITYRCQWPLLFIFRLSGHFLEEIPQKVCSICYFDVHKNANQ